MLFILATFSTLSRPIARTCVELCLFIALLVLAISYFPHQQRMTFQWHYSWHASSSVTMQWRLTHQETMMMPFGLQPAFMSCS